MHNIFRFILFYRVTHDPFCSINIKITTFDRYIVVKDVSVKERHFSDNLIFNLYVLRTLTSVSMIIRLILALKIMS